MGTKDSTSTHTHTDAMHSEILVNMLVRLMIFSAFQVSSRWHSRDDFCHTLKLTSSADWR